MTGGALIFDSKLNNAVVSVSNVGTTVDFGVSQLLTSLDIGDDTVVTLGGLLLSPDWNQDLERNSVERQFKACRSPVVRRCSSVACSHFLACAVAAFSRRLVSQ